MLGKGLIAIALLVFMAGHSAAAEPLSFAAAMERLEADSHVLDAARRELAAARAEAEVARGRRLPSLALEGKATRLDEPLGLELSEYAPALGGLLPPGLVPDRLVIQERQFYNLSLEARLALYSGGRIAAGIAAGEAGAEAGQAALAATRAELHELLVQRYFGLSLADQAVSVRQATVDGLGRHLAHATRMEEEGLIARAERLRANVALAEAERDLQTAEESRSLAASALAALLAMSGQAQPTTPIPPPPAAPSPERFINEMRASSPTLAELRARKAQAEAAVRAERGSLLPTLGAFGRRELYTDDLTLLDPEWAVGLVARWTLFDGGQRRGRLDQAAARADRVTALLADAERQLEVRVRQRHQQLVTALARLDSFVATRDLAEESLRAQQRAFEEGLTSSLDVIDAELALSRVRLGELDARRQAWVALAGLLAAVDQTDQLVERVSEQLAASSPTLD
ncbi:TolC family protein [Wenzhouxiangella limi]|uniref:TolC family protein n=1 Tax=Wenzhouxiangella limi TaxID=2707351 RepID=A0A845VFI9_9GAMM|nr:TolC family protein [Wenzhouxiangella limi]